MTYLLVMIVTVVLGLIGQLAVKGAYKKWGNTPSAINATGADIAIRMLNEAGEQDVQVNVIEGTLSDYFDPTTKTLNLSRDVAYGTTVAAHAIACHEAGHYLQFCEGYSMMKLRHVLVPVTNFASSLTWIILIVGMVLSSVGLVYAAAACYAVSLVFSIVTLPVEFNASHRAIKYLDGKGDGTLAGVMVPQSEKNGTRTMLRSAALTYVMATLASVINLLYILSIADR